MGWITKALGLTLKVPDAGDKNWASGFLADFVDKVSAHDHTGSPNGLQIASGAIATGAVTAAKLGADAVETAKIKALNVTAAKLAANAVETAKIKDLNVTAAKLAADAVETAKIKDLNVTTAKIAAANITAAKLATDVRSIFQISAGKVLYNTTEVYCSPAMNAVSITLPNAIGYGVAMPHAGVIRELRLVSIGETASQDCDTIMKLYKNGVYASIIDSVTCTDNTTIQTTWQVCNISFVVGDVFTVGISGGGASGSNLFNISVSISQG